MLVHFRDRQYLLIAFIIVLLITFGVLSAINGGVWEAGRVLTFVDEEKPVIIIDAGHGGVDGGAIGAGGTVEKNINLQMAFKLRKRLLEDGYIVVMTRLDDSSIHNSDADTIREKKSSDLKNRLELTKMYPNSVLVSIHQNITGSSKVSGAQVFYSPNDPRSAQLAQYVQNAFNTGTQSDNTKSTVRAGKNLYLFYNAKNVAILCECGFLSNPQEEELLCTDEYQQKLVDCIYSGLTEYMQEQYKDENEQQE